MIQSNLNTGVDTITLANNATVSNETSSHYIIGNVEGMAFVGAGASTLGGLGFNIAAGSDDIGNVKVFRKTGPLGIITNWGKTTIARNYRITAEHQPTTGRNITFSWFPLDDNSKDMTQMRLWKSINNGFTFDTVGGVHDVSALDPRTLSYKTYSFSDWTASDEDAPLPIALLQFDAIPNKNVVDLFWTTLSEINNDYFTVERSKNLVDFDDILKVKGAGNSSRILHYKAVDEKPLKGISYYRLKQTDFDGKTSYSDIKIVRFANDIFGISKPYPNPANKTISFNINSPEKDKIDIVFYDELGQTILIRKDYEIEEGEQIISSDLSNLSNGIYMIVVRSKMGTFSTHFSIIKH
jgi:hypothetical protein